jgi:hypothetical protein
VDGHDEAVAHRARQTPANLGEYDSRSPYERPFRRKEKLMTVSRKAWIAIGVLAVVAAIAVIALVASGGGGSAGGGY